MKFTYRCGQQPLPGYTIKRGIGWGGFGEVYFAVSDSGKEVALKWVRSNLDVELRGIQQCLNLKHPNLIHLYDLKQDAVGQQWLVMEYVSGESLSTIMSRHPNGLAPELACEWFTGLAAGVHYLHEHGIVHRDLKPGNIFLEAGVIKVGDYGLCKLIGGSHVVDGADVLRQAALTVADQLAQAIVADLDDTVLQEDVARLQVAVNEEKPRMTRITRMMRLASVPHPCNPCNPWFSDGARP